jgi:hypothetical protein
VITPPTCSCREYLPFWFANAGKLICTSVEVHMHQTISQKHFFFFFWNSVYGIRSRIHGIKQMYKLNSLDNDTGVKRTRLLRKDSSCEKLPKKYGQCAKVNSTRTT